MSNVYGSLAGDSNYKLWYTATDPVGAQSYPDETDYAILGPIYAPRIYGLGLNALEIASSGLVSFTLNDTHALTLGKNAATNVTDVNTVGNSSYRVSAGADSNVSVTLDAARCNYHVFAKKDIVLETVDGGFHFTSSNSVIDLLAGAANSTSNRAEISLSNVGFLDMFASDRLNIIGESNTLIEGKHDVELRRSAAATSARFALTSNNDVATSADAFHFHSSNYYNFAVQTNDVFRIDKDKVTLFGDFDIHGTLNSISTTVTELEVQDKTILLAASDGGSNAIVDGSNNDKAGVIVNGLPAGASNSNLYRKHIQWNYGSNGIDALLTSNIERESFWDVRGGSLRLSATKPTTGNDISMGLRINEKDEFEWVRHYVDSNNVPRVRSFVRFGRK